MSEEILGGCLCGTVRYHYIGETGPCAYCHCVDCRKTTGSAFNVSIRFELHHLYFNRKDCLGRFTKLADSGNLLTRVFCQECGSPLFTESPAHLNFVWVKAGTLDNPSFVQPSYQSWTESRVDWAHIHADLAVS